MRPSVHVRPSVCSCACACVCASVRVRPSVRVRASVLVRACVRVRPCVLCYLFTAYLHFPQGMTPWFFTFRARDDVSILLQISAFATLVSLNTTELEFKKDSSLDFSLLFVPNVVYFGKKNSLATEYEIFLCVLCTVKVYSVAGVVSIFSGLMQNGGC